MKGLGTHLAETPQEIFGFLYQLIMQHLCFGAFADCSGSETAKKGRRLGIRYTFTMHFSSSPVISYSRPSVKLCSEGFFFGQVGSGTEQQPRT